VLRLNTQ